MPGRRMKILIVEDEPQIRLLIGQRLTSFNPAYLILEAGSGAAALAVVPEVQPDLILLDIRMPGMDGFEVCRRLKADPDLNLIPVIFLTAMEQPKDKLEGFKVGGADYLVKPVQPEELKVRVEAHLRIREAMEERAILKEVQEQLMHAAKMAAMGEVSAGVAHEMNQPLMGLSSYFETLLMHDQVASSEELKDKLIKMKHQLQRLHSIVKRISEHSKKRAPQMSLEDIQTPIANSIFILQQQLKDKNIELQVAFDPKVPELYIDPYQIEDIIINFLSNARDVLDETYHEKAGGRIRVFTKLFGPEDAVVVGVQDNGKAVSPEAGEKIFESFFTTKGPKRGTGLGLSVSAEIAKNHQGFIHFVNLDEPGKIFYFALPLKQGYALSQAQGLRESLEAKLKKWQIFRGA